MKGENNAEGIKVLVRMAVFCQKKNKNSLKLFAKHDSPCFVADCLQLVCG